MTGKTDIRLLGFSGFKASEHFLRALDDEICVSRWGAKEKISADRPEDLNTDDAMRAALEQPSMITVVSAHAGYFDGHLGFCGDRDQPVLTLDSIGILLGAESMLLIDACCAPELAAELEEQKHARPGSLIVGLGAAPGEEQFTRGRDSVTVIGAVIRELCYPPTPDLSPQAAARAVDLVNIQISARNDAEHDGRRARPPLLFKHECR